MLTLRAESRGLTKSARSDARRRDYIPAVVYGKGIDPAPIMVEGAALRSALRDGGRHKLIRLEGLDQTCTVLVKDVQVDNLHHSVIHVDFHKPAEGQKVRLRVPVVVTGDEQLTRRALIMTHQLSEIEVECMPDQVPAALWVDVATREPGDDIKVGDLAVPAGVRVMGDPEAVVLNIDAPEMTMIPEVAAEVTTAG